MSREYRDYREYTTSGRSGQQRLPPIRDVFGDVLEQPAQPRPSYYSSEHHSSRQHSYTVASGTTSRSMPSNINDDQPSHPSLHLPPLRSRSASAASHSVAPSASKTPWTSTYTRSRTDEKDRERPVHKGDPSLHSYDVFMTSSSQGLVHQRSSRNDDFHQIAKEEAISASTGRYACPECGRRFEKSSHFKNHLTSHSGEKPYECSWPGCGKTFGASSNMRRHYRTHGAADDSREN